MENMNVQITESYRTSGYETFSGFIDGKQFRIGRGTSQENSFGECLKGDLNSDQVKRIFDGIDMLRKHKKML